MQTAFSFGQFYSFLAQEERDRNPSIWWSIRISRAQILFLGAWLAGLAVMPMNLTGAFGTLAIALTGSMLTVLLVRVFRSFDELSGPMSWFQRIAEIVIFAWVISGVLGVGSHALYTLVPIGIAPVSMGLVVMCLSLSVFLALVSIEETDSRVPSALLAIVTLTVLFLALVSTHLFLDFEYIAYLPGLSLVIVQTIFFTVWIGREEGWEGALAVFAVASGIVGCQLLGVWLVGDLDWYDSLVVVVSVAGFIFILQEKSTLSLLLALLFVAFSLGGLFGGVPGSFAGAVFFGLFLGFFAILLMTRTPILVYLKDLTQSLTERTERLTEVLLYSPGLVRTLAVARRLPLRFQRFSAYAEQALLLKRTAGDYEFVHLLLRDYFALRDLQPKLTDEDRERRIEAVRSLGFQGESAIDALTDYSRSGHPDEREAAVWALGRIASPKVADLIEAALSDDHPKFRSAAVLEIRTLKDEDRERLLALIVDSSDLSVQRAFVEMALGSLEGVDNRRFEGPIRLIIDRDHLWQHVIQFMEESKDPSIRSSAATALGNLRDANAVSHLIKSLSDREDKVSYSAANALRAIGTPEALAALEKSQN